MAALAEREKQRQQRRADEQPVADRDIDRHGAGNRTKDESCRDHQHVDDHDVLQRQTNTGSSGKRYAAATMPNWRAY